ncbi:MAG: thioredoxin family protein [Prosthecobacter sp.]|jgi:thioredoxin-related protein|nr:thioredoxin family protein [Prosthecobacter sp.]
MKKIITLLLAAICIPLHAADFPPGSPKFNTSFGEALSSAKKEGKPVIVVFSASWCPPCQAMKKNVYPSAEVKQLHDKFVWVYLDVDDDANSKVAQKFKVQGIPHVQFLDKNGSALTSQVGGVSPAEFAKLLATVAEKAGK